MFTITREYDNRPGSLSTVKEENETFCLDRTLIEPKRGIHFSDVKTRRSARLEEERKSLNR